MITYDATVKAAFVVTAEEDAEEIAQTLAKHMAQALKDFAQHPLVALCGSVEAEAVPREEPINA